MSTFKVTPTGREMTEAFRQQAIKYLQDLVADLQAGGVVTSLEIERDVIEVPSENGYIGLRATGHQMLIVTWLKKARSTDAQTEGGDAQ